MLKGLLGNAIAAGGHIVTPTYVSAAGGVSTAHVFTFGSVVIDTLATDIIVVAAMSEDSGATTVVSCTVSGVPLTKWGSGDVTGAGAVGQFSDTFFYGAPGVFNSANFVATGTGTGTETIALTIWKLRGASPTPTAEFPSAIANSGSAIMGPITRSAGGVVLGHIATNSARLSAETWSGSEAVTEDLDVLTTTAQCRIAAFRISSLVSGSADSFTVTLSGATNHLGGAISFIAS